MKKIEWIFGFAASVSVVIILLITSFQAAMYLDFGIYEHEYEKYDVLSSLDMEMEDAMYVTKEMMAYLRGDREELSVITTVDGTEQDFFNEQDRFHMGEVQGLFIGGLHLRTGAVIVLILCVGFLVFRKAELRKILSRSYQITLVIFGIMTALLGAAVAIDFNAVFTKFHEIFFDNDLWLFDPAEDYMIRMLPEGLFFDMVIRIGWMFALGLILLLVISIIFKKERNISKDYE